MASGIRSAIQLDLDKYRGHLEYETEHELNRQPLRIDLVVVKKDAGLVIEEGIASAFRGHNILEFKSQRDGLSIDDLFKVIAYGCLYKARGESADAIQCDDVTLTLIRRSLPEGGLMRALEVKGYPVCQTQPGIYDVTGLQFPTRLVVTSQIDPSAPLWLSSLGTDIADDRLKELVRAAGAIEDGAARALSNAVLDAVVRANGDAAERIKKEDEDMAMTLLELMKPEIDRARSEGIEEGLERGMVRGMRRGMELGRAEVARDTARRMLGLGGFSREQIAEVTGLSLAEIESIAATMPPAA